MINEGIKYNVDQFTFDYDIDKEHYIIKLVEVPIYESNFIKNAYYYGYRFENNIDGTLKSKFIEYIKKSTSETILNSDMFNFITDAVDKLDKKIKLNTFDIVIYPQSKSGLVRNILMHVYNYTRPNFKTIELVKNSIDNIAFDKIAYDVYANKQKLNRHDRKILDVNIQKILDDIKIYDYFSIANAVKKPKYRKFFKDFLIFKNKEDEQLFNQLENSNVLIVDDINTSGTTITECLRLINSVNSDSKKVVFTLIGGETHKM
jgi:phosphoribosylpyrophosphate synthetase